MSMLTFDDTVLQVMRDYITAVNRARHAHTQVEARSDSTAHMALLRELNQDEMAAEAAISAALISRGWQPPYIPAARTAV